jgi:hypothetical protein
MAQDVKREPAWQGFDVPGAIQKYLDLESSASRISWSESLRVPGLLQTQAYARAMLESVGPVVRAGGQEVEVLLRLRILRQRRLVADPPLTLDVVIDEAVVTRRVGSAAVMANRLGV